MGKNFNGKERLEMFGFELIAIMADGQKETITKIEEEIDKGTVVKYINSKYQHMMFNIFDANSPYNIKDWENEFNSYSGVVQGNESRKFGVTKEEDGLLLLLALTLDLVASRK